jgi:hypothetical protein
LTIPSLISAAVAAIELARVTPASTATSRCGYDAADRMAGLENCPSARPIYSAMQSHDTREKKGRVESSHDEPVALHASVSGRSMKKEAHAPWPSRDHQSTEVS